jgi:hypothetical protein
VRLALRGAIHGEQMRATFTEQPRMPCAGLRRPVHRAQYARALYNMRQAAGRITQLPNEEFES